MCTSRISMCLQVWNLPQAFLFPLYLWDVFTYAHQVQSIQSYVTTAREVASIGLSELGDADFEGAREPSPLRLIRVMEKVDGEPVSKIWEKSDPDHLNFVHKVVQLHRPLLELEASITRAMLTFSPPIVNGGIPWLGDRSCGRWSQCVLHWHGSHFSERFLVGRTIFDGSKLVTKPGNHLRLVSTQGFFLLNTWPMSSYVSRPVSIVRQSPSSRRFPLQSTSPRKAGQSYRTFGVLWIPSSSPRRWWKLIPSGSSMAPGLACWELVGRSVGLYDARQQDITLCIDWQGAWVPPAFLQLTVPIIYRALEDRTGSPLPSNPLR